MVAYHFPPLAGSSGIQRTLRFVQHLPLFGWQPLVLSAHPMAYERIGSDLLDEVPVGTVVRRALALDTARHLAVSGRYIGFMARPDRWVSWKFDAVRQGLRMIDQFKPAAIWSTYPIATAHLIGAELHRRTGLPWLADFRDPMAQEGYPADPLTHRHFVCIEREAVERAALSTFSAPGAARMYRDRYPSSAERLILLENGYDEDSFAAAERANGLQRTPLNPGMVTMLHSGIVYPSERDPTQLVVALGRLQQAAQVRSGDFKLRFRAAVHDELLLRLARQHGVESFIEVLPPLPYREALQEMLRADALLVMQSSNCNEQVPAKIYEYLRANRPILCLSDPIGDTVAVLRIAGVGSFARLDSADEIASLMPAFVASLRDGWAGLPEPRAVRAASRLARCEALAALFDGLRPTTLTEH